MEYDLIYLQKVAGMTKKRIEAMEKYYVTLPIQTKIEIEKLKTDLYFQLKKELLNMEKKPEFTYAMTLRATAAVHSIENFAKTKNPDQSKASTVTDLKIARLRAERKAKAAPVRTWIEEHYPDISELRERGASWREVAAYIKRFHRKGLNASYVRKSWLEIRTVLSNEKQPT